MSRISLSLAASTLTLISAAGIAAAQQSGTIQAAPPVTSPPIVTPTSPATPGAINPGNPGVVQGSATLNQGTLQSNQNQANDRYDARRAPNEARSGAGMSVKEALVGKLIESNRAEIELAQIAQQKAQSDQVKQFAQQLIQDHQAVVSQLEQMKSGQAQTGNAPGQARTSTNQDGSTIQAGGQSQSTDSAAQTGGAITTSENNSTVQQTRGNRNEATSQGNQPMMGQGQRVPQTLVQISKQACENSLQMSKQMLEEHQGNEFDMAFVGHQIVHHTMALAELKAIESNGPQELQSVVQQARTKVENHLQQAKQLANQLKDKGESKPRANS